jgi:hypothetical protein
MNLLKKKIINSFLSLILAILPKTLAKDAMIKAKMNNNI